MCECMRKLQEIFADIVQDCAIKCHELTYSNVFQECEEYQGRSSINESMDEYSTELVPGLTSYYYYCS